MNILITGGAGFIGSHITDAYLKAGHTVTVLDNFSTGKRSNLAEHANLRIIEADIRDEKRMREIVREMQPNMVNHHAAQVSVVVSAQEPLLDTQLNVIGLVNVLDAIRHEAPKAKLIFPSSGGTVYDPESPIPYTEETASDPHSFYGLSKHTGERYIRQYSRLYDLNSTIFRYGNVYGPRQDPHGEAGVCAIFSERMLADQPVTIFGDGGATRDYIYISDVVAANLLALEVENRGVFNIGTGLKTSTQEVFKTLKQATGYSYDPQSAPLRPGELNSVQLSVEKALQHLGRKSEVNFSEGIAKTVEWYKNSQ